MDRRLTFEEAIERFAAAAYLTARPDRPGTEAAIATLYKAAGLDAPPVVWGASPRSACQAADETVGPIECSTLPGERLPAPDGPQYGGDEVSHILLPWPNPTDDVWVPNFGAEAAYPEALWRVIGFGHGLRDHPAHIGSFRYWEETNEREQWAMIRFVENVGWWRLHRTHAFVSERPTSIVLDHRNRPHSMSAPAVTFRGGWELYAVDGLRLPSWTVTEPERLTPEEIDEIHNAELRRVLVTLAGDRYIEDRGSLVRSDDWGELWEVPDVDGRFLRVTDATPLPDGTSKRYWLRVPHNQRTAHGAVAWTFGLTEDDYLPEVQT